MRDLAFSFGVEVLDDFFFADGSGGDAIGWDFDFTNPAECVENGFTEILVLPVFVVVTAGEAEAASAIGTFYGPHECFVASFRFLNVWVWSLGVDVGAIADGIVWRGNKDGSEFDALNFFRT